jgi:hypothetical protein
MMSRGGSRDFYVVSGAISLELSVCTAARLRQSPKTEQG